MQYLMKVFYLVCLISIICMLLMDYTVFVALYPEAITAALKVIFLDWGFWGWILLPIIFIFSRLRIFAAILLIALTPSTLTYFYTEFFQTKPIVLSYPMPWQQVNEVGAIACMIAVILGYVYFFWYFVNKFKRQT